MGCLLFCFLPIISFFFLIPHSYITETPNIPCTKASAGCCICSTVICICSSFPGVRSEASPCFDVSTSAAASNANPIVLLCRPRRKKKIVLKNVPLARSRVCPTALSGKKFTRSSREDDAKTTILKRGSFEKRKLINHNRQWFEFTSKILI